MTEVQEVLYQWKQGRSERSIARSLKVSRNTIRRILKQAQSIGLSLESDQERFEEASEPLFKLRYEQSARQSPAQAYIADHHEQIATWRSMPYMTVNQMVRLFAEQNKKISEMSLRRYIRKHFPVAPTTTMHLEVLPGSQAQVDFCYVGRMRDCVSGKLRKAYAFIMTLSFSRHRFVRFVFRQDIKTWIDCHIRAFHFFGGVPCTILLDNLKAGVWLAEIYDPTINRSYAELERYYGFIADPTKVRTPEHKGKVERSVQIVRQQILAGREFEDIEKANGYALQWCRYEISHRITRTTGKTPWDLFTQVEKPTLKTLPTTDYECPIWQKAKVHRDQHLVFESSFYSVSCQYVGKSVWVRATQRMIEVYCDERKIKAHIRAQAKGQWVTDQQDYPKYARSFLEKDAAYCLEEAKTIGSFTHQLMKITLERVSLTNQRKAQAILRLAEKYGRDRLDLACKRALHFDNTRYKSLQRILDQGLDQAEEESKYSLNSSLRNGSYLRNPQEFSVTSQGEIRL